MLDPRKPIAHGHPTTLTYALAQNSHKTLGKCLQTSHVFPWHVAEARHLDANAPGGARLKSMHGRAPGRSVHLTHAPRRVHHRRLCERYGVRDGGIAARSDRLGRDGGRVSSHAIRWGWR